MVEFSRHGRFAGKNILSRQKRSIVRGKELRISMVLLLLYPIRSVKYRVLDNSIAIDIANFKDALRTQSHVLTIEALQITPSARGK